ncbi:bifunctional metallophosphatase/5'-nucleotidase [Nonomuraea mangrovi]|uniref:Bifunctional metallophosphatase/5'-nucleotidase n=1 Tax=Nonomuraea mangrovi TaxID=2316207 RepID=A0ABW4SNR7_9ACTN
MTSRSFLPLVVAGAIGLGGLALVAGPADAARPERTVPVRLLTINDLHGNLEPPSGSSSRILDPNGPLVDADGKLTGIVGGKYSIAGGAAYLAAHVEQRTDRNTMLVAAGDLIGASPLISAAYHDEPTLQVLGQMGLKASSAGNHEFDEGYAELQRLMKGGCHPVDGCSPDGRWRGTDFDFLGANVLKERNDRYALPPYFIKRINGVKVGFIGLVTATTPTIVSSSGIQGLKFTEEVAAANKVSRLLARVGVKAQVVLVHEGDQITPNQDPSACSVTPGNGSRIAKGLDPQIDMIVSGHSHQAYICKANDPAGQPRVYTQGSSFGRVVTQIDFQVDRRSGDVVRSSVVAGNHVVTRDVTEDAEVAATVKKWKDASAAIANKQVGTISAEIGTTAAPSGELPLGNLIADSQLEATKTGGNAQIAFMNPGGVRAPLNYPSSPAGEGDGVVTYGEAFTVQPFNNLTQVITLTGAQLKTALEQQFVGGPNNQAFTKILQPSANFTYTYSRSAPWGSKVSNMKIDGVAVTDGQSIRVAVNNFLVGGGDAFAEFKNGTDLWSGPLDIDAFVDYLGRHSPVAPPATNRITVVD